MASTLTSPAEETKSGGGRASEIDGEKENDIYDLANHRRFSTRKRRNINNTSAASTTQPRPAKSLKRSTKEAIESVFPLEVGTEIILNGKIKENLSFSGEVLVVQEVKGGNYRLVMANPCHGLWGNNIIRSEASLSRNISIVRTPDVPLIPIEFTLLNAVYDIRSSSISQKYPVESTLQGWRWVNNWERLSWTTQPTHLSYQHIFEMAKAAIVDNFNPAQGEIALSSINHCFRKQAEVSFALYSSPDQRFQSSH